MASNTPQGITLGRFERDPFAIGRNLGAGVGERAFAQQPRFGRPARTGAEPQHKNFRKARRVLLPIQQRLAVRRDRQGRGGLVGGADERRRAAAIGGDRVQTELGPGRRRAVDHGAIVRRPDRVVVASGKRHAGRGATVESDDPDIGATVRVDSARDVMPVVGEAAATPSTRHLSWNRLDDALAIDPGERAAFTAQSNGIDQHAVLRKRVIPGSGWTGRRNRLHHWRGGSQWPQRARVHREGEQVPDRTKVR